MWVHPLRLCPSKDTDSVVRMVKLLKVKKKKKNSGKFEAANQSFSSRKQVQMD